MKHLLRAVIATLVIGFTLQVQAAEPPTFTDFEGKPSSIEAHTGDGKWLVVMFWAHNCHVCNVEAENYAQFHVDHKDSKARVLGISIDGAENKAKAEDFIARHDLPFPNLIAEPVPAMLRYMSLTQEQFRGTPTILVYNPDGKLTAAQPGAVPISSIEAFIERQSNGAAQAG